MNPPPSPPVPSAESRAQTAEAIGDIYNLFGDEDSSPVRPFRAPLPDTSDAPVTTTRTRKSDSGRDNRVEGCPSPLKSKRRTTRSASSSAARVDATPARVSGAGAEPPSTNAADDGPTRSAPAPPRVSLSPDQLDVSVAETPTEGGPNTVRADPNPKKKSKQPIDKSRKVVLGKQFLTYLRPDTFDTKKFKKGHATVYTTDAMDEHDSSFLNQAQWNFDSARAKLRKSAGESLGRMTRSDLDAAADEDVVETMNYKQMSRYVVEDILSSKVGTQFLLCISTNLDAHHHNVLSMSARIQRSRGVGGEQVRITGRTFFA